MAETLVFDIDECLVNSVEKHFRLLKQWAKEHGHSEVASLTYSKFCAGGGTKQFEALWPEYHEYCEFTRQDPNFNRGLIEVPGSRAAQQSLASEAHAYLTTRPEDVTTLTHEEVIVLLNFLNLKIVARPNTVPISQTTPWKLSMLEEMVQRTGSPKIMLDDQVSMYEAIVQNRNPWIAGILIKGDRTPDDRGALSWRDVPNAVRSIIAGFNFGRRT